jgi:hypothetical protein
MGQRGQYGKRGGADQAHHLDAHQLDGQGARTVGKPGDKQRHEQRRNDGDDEHQHAGERGQADAERPGRPATVGFRSA